MHTTVHVSIRSPISTCHKIIRGFGLQSPQVDANLRTTKAHTTLDANLHLHIYTCAHVYTCRSVCVLRPANVARTQTYIHTYIYMLAHIHLHNFVQWHMSTTVYSYVCRHASVFTHVIIHRYTHVPAQNTCTQATALFLKLHASRNIRLNNL